MEALDGNALAGPLFEFFGEEMTAARGRCAHCGAVAQVAELRVYVRAPGSVIRCRACGSVVMVLVSLAQTLRLDASCFELLTEPDS